jgi:DNA-binding response OmpR family regulator
MKALIVDDDRALADLLAFTLRREGFQVVLAFDAASALHRFEHEQPEVVVLDVNLPGTPEVENGFAVCRAIRAQGDVPVILLTVRGEEEDILLGLELGADDYVLKPFSPRQLVARIHAVLRRGGTSRSSARPVLRYGDLEFEVTRRSVRRAGRESNSLTRLEARLLEYLMLNSGHPLAGEDLIAHVWGPDAGSPEMLRQLIRRLRTKVEVDPAAPDLLRNVPGWGYGFGLGS